MDGMVWCGFKSWYESQFGFECTFRSVLYFGWFSAFNLFFFGSFHWILFGPKTSPFAWSLNVVNQVNQFWGWGDGQYSQQRLGIPPLFKKNKVCSEVRILMPFFWEFGKQGESTQGHWSSALPWNWSMQTSLRGECREGSRRWKKRAIWRLRASCHALQLVWCRRQKYRQIRIYTNWNQFLSVVYNVILLYFVWWFGSCDNLPCWRVFGENISFILEVLLVEKWLCLEVLW